VDPEPLLLGLEGRHATTAGLDTPVAVMHDLTRWALLHGFRLAGLQGFGRLVLEEDWARIRRGPPPDQAFHPGSSGRAGRVRR
jgi:hypothetical protein